MANIKSQIKRNRTNEAARERNKAVRSEVRTRIKHAEAAVAAGVHPEALARLATLRPLQRMGEEVADSALERLAELEARLDREFAELVPAGAPATPADAVVTPVIPEASDATDR